MHSIHQFSPPKMKPPMPHLGFKICNSEVAAIRPISAFCGSENGEQWPNMIGKRNGDSFSNESAGETNLLIQIKHNDVKEKFSTVIRQPSSHDNSYE